MINKDKEIISRKQILMKIYCIIKENTPQIAISIPILTAIYASIRNYYFYIVNCGYYKYFGIEDNFMLPYNKINLYQNIGQLTLYVVYWGFCIFAVRIFLLKGNYLEKFILFFFVPLVINVIITYDGFFSWILIIVSAIFIPIHWLMIFSIGYCMIATFHDEKSNKPNRKKEGEDKRRKWGVREYRLLGLLLISMSIIFLFLGGYFSSYSDAENQKRFGVISIDTEKYAVIDSNTDKLILQKCYIKKNNLIIDKNTYVCIKNDVEIRFKTFDTVKVYYKED